MTNPESEPPLLPWDDDTPANGFPPIHPSPPRPGPRFSRTHLALIIVASAVAISGGTVVALTTANNQPSQAAVQATPPNSTSTSQPGATATAPTAPSATGPALPTPSTTAGTTTPPPVSAQPTTTTAQPPPTRPQTPPPPPDLCGAPPNPYGYNFCGGSPLAEPASDVCSYLNCVANFFNGKGFVVECQDNTFSKSGGTKDVCPKHVGYLQTLYR